MLRQVLFGTEPSQTRKKRLRSLKKSLEKALTPYFQGVTTHQQAKTNTDFRGGNKMGWTFTNTDLTRKEAVNEMFNWTNERFRTRVLKSAMKGSTYYGAVEQIDAETATRTVTGVVVLTSSDKKNGFNFGYKTMDETMGPTHCECPKNILDLLTDADNEYALKWRKRCRENLERPKLSDLPLGTRIRVKLAGEEKEFVKWPPCNQFRTPVWVNPESNTYLPKKWIKEFTVVEN